MNLSSSLEIEKIRKIYFKKIDLLDLDILIATVLKKDRSFIIAHPELKLKPEQLNRLKKNIQRRIEGEPLAYILGEKEFFGLNFKVNRHTLIPRPETELLVESALKEILDIQYSISNIIDVGTGSGNILISIAHNMEHEVWNIHSANCFAIDISSEALKIAKKNATLNKINNIRFLHGNLLNPVLKSKTINYKSSFLILANLPYLSKEIYTACPTAVKAYEPETALYSARRGLAHYEKLLAQILKLKKNHPSLRIVCFMEISPEQKKPATLLIKKYFPQSKPQFKKDLAQKWRLSKVII